MYLTDYREYSLKDVITQLEPNLFRKVTGLTVKDFEMLVSIGLFNDSLMNEAVYNFKRYEDASLEYTGIEKHAEDRNVGLFSTVISKKEYEEMAAAQMASMEENPFRTIVTAVKDDSPKPAPAGQKKSKVDELRTPVAVAAEPGADIPEKPAMQDVSPKNRTQNLAKVGIGTLVWHKKFGVGKITGMRKGKIMVSFPAKNVTFQFPQAFEQGFIILEE